MKTFLAAVSLLGPALVGMAADDLVAPGAQVTVVASEFRFAEGPASNAAGDVFFTDQPNDRIMKWSAADGKLTTFLQPSGRANGMCFDRAGALWACADEKNEVWKIAPDGNHEVVVKNHEGKLLNGPNDLWCRADGAIYFTDPCYQRDYWTRDRAEQVPRAVYFLSADRQKLTRVAEGMEQPNGIVGTPDGKLLYVADHQGRKTYRFTVQPDGSLTDRALFCDMGSDGMTMDERGNVYLTFDGVAVFSPEGKKIAQLDLPGDRNRPTNVCFGGADRRTLFITAPRSVYTVRLNVAGASGE